MTCLFVVTIDSKLKSCCKDVQKEESSEEEMS